jgi:hypothetical protein
MAGVGPQPGYGVVNQQFGPLRYAARRGSLFRGGNQAVVATALQTGLTTASTGGLILYNPLTSKVNLSILEAAFGFIVAQTAAGVIGLAVGYNATTAPTGTLTAITPVNALAGSSVAPVGKLYSSATITLPTAPVLAKILTTVETGAITVAPNDGPATSNIGGGIELTPGSYCLFVSSGASVASSFFGSFAWEECAP